MPSKLSLSCTCIDGCEFPEQGSRSDRYTLPNSSTYCKLWTCDQLHGRRRHYVHRIRVLNIERNTKPEERQKVVQHINYLRRAARTQESYIEVRIRGRKIDSRKWNRWLNDSAGQLAVVREPPSRELCTYYPPFVMYWQIIIALPAFVSVCACSPYDFQRIVRYAGHQTRTLDLQEARDVFQDLEIILSCRSSSSYRNDTIVDECIIQVKNFLRGNILVESKSCSLEFSVLVLKES